MKNLVIASLVAMCCFSVGANYYKDHVYSRTAVVVDIDKTNDIVTVRDAVGYEWEFTGVEDWYYMDVVAMTMYDNSTPENILDDEIVHAVYSGTIDMLS